MSAPVVVIQSAEDAYAQVIADEVAKEVTAEGWVTLASTTGSSQIDALVIVRPTPAMGVAFVDVTDDQLETSLEQFLDLFDRLREGLPGIRDGGAVLVVSDRGHLGGWRGANEMAFSGAVAGLMRSVALENAGRRIRANVIAVELPDAKPSTDPAAVAKLAAFLLSPAAVAVNGELILANGGRSLQIREARDRRATADTRPDHRP